jgi:hypothetical protein
VSARELRIDLLAEHLQLQPVERPLIDWKTRAGSWAGSAG